MSQEWALLNRVLKEGLNFPQLPELEMLEPGWRRKELYSEALRFVPPSPWLNGERRSIHDLINKPDSHLGIEFEGIIWVGWEIFASFCNSVFVSVSSSLDTNRRSLCSVGKIKRSSFSQEFLVQQFFRHTYGRQTDFHWRLAPAKRTMENPSASYKGNMIIAKITCLNNGLI